MQTETGVWSNASSVGTFFVADGFTHIWFRTFVESLLASAGIWLRTFSVDTRWITTWDACVTPELVSLLAITTIWLNASSVSTFRDLWIASWFAAML